MSDSADHLLKRKLEPPSVNTVDDSTSSTNQATNQATVSTSITPLSTMPVTSSETSYVPLPQTSTTVPLAFCVVQNHSGASDLVLTQLIQLKSIFGRQLPKMPKPYITRLVFDRRHKSLILYLNPTGPPNTITNLTHLPSPQPLGAMVGGICYRAYEQEKFAEIAFCAVQASQQVKGYGSVVMNLLKEQGLREGIEYFITYADNYAVGYFKKLGFTKGITMPRGRYLGLIKDYDGGTMMECYLHKSVPYTSTTAMVKKQHDFVMGEILKRAKSHIVYEPDPVLGGGSGVDGDDLGDGNKTTASGAGTRGGGGKMHNANRNIMIKGVREAGWTEADIGGKGGMAKPVKLSVELTNIVKKVKSEAWSWPYHAPVNPLEAPSYYNVIKNPIDLQTIEQRIRKGGHYQSNKQLRDDLQLMGDNCKHFNPYAEGGENGYWETAVALHRWIGEHEFMFKDKSLGGDR